MGYQARGVVRGPSCGYFEEGKASLPQNYRPISLLNCLYKVYARMVAVRLLGEVGHKLSPTQFGFRHHRSTSDPVHILKRAQDLAQAKKFTTLHLVFLDWEKAFDRVLPSAILEALDELGVSAPLRAIIRRLILSPKFSTKVGDLRSTLRSQEVGVRQGCTLPPLLFILLLSTVTARVKDTLKREIPLAMTPLFNFCDLEFADDTTIVAKTAEAASLVLCSLEKEGARVGLRLNKSKCVELAINSDQPVFFLSGDRVPRA
eukprot:11852310-Alexandrium_andersonii.AAC.1